MKHAERGRRSGSVWRNLIQGTQNALEIARAGRLAPEVRAPFAVVRRERMYKLRRYERTRGGEPLGAPLLLIPPLMVTPEVYDIDPSISAVRLLTDAGIDVFLVDFGIPELEEGGLARTLDDHVRAVDQAIEQVRTITGSDVHLAGYSQGGMFCYQACAYRRSANVKSIVTYGAPVDLHRNLALSHELATRFIDSFSGVTRKLIDAMEGLPGAFSSYGFRMLSVRKELKQLATFVANLHDREALMRGESSRRFLHGEGFVYWPGPALRTFFDEFVVDNRLSQGGFVVDGRSLTLADITCPIFYFHGERDQFARADSVRAIAQAAPLAPSYGYGLRTGHFGLVVGSVAMKHTWPATVQWIAWLAGQGDRPEPHREKRSLPSVLPNVTAPIEENLEEVEYNARLLLDTARGTAKRLHKSLHDVSHAATGFFDNVRYQLPRLSRLARLSSDSYVSCGRTLAEQAARIGDHTFFLWGGRAHTYAAADRRVDAIVRGLIACAITPGMRVGVLMHARPTYLSLVAALSRLGAVAVLISPDGERVGLLEALALGEVQALISDPEHAARAREAFTGPVLVLGGGGAQRTLIEGVIDMERIDPDDVDLPDWYEPNPGRAADLAMILFTAGKNEQPRAARITNRRWAVAAYGAAAASTLTSKDTVYCCMPLHHAAGLLVSVGGALVGGARLALSDAFRPDVFWTEVRRYGATVVFYAGEMCRALVDAPPALGDGNNPVRLFAGSGMRIDVWRRLVERFNAGVLEFYATTEGNAVLANVAASKVGSLGKPLPGTSDLLLAAYDFDAQTFVKGPDGSLEACFAGQPGMLIARIDPGHPVASFDGFVDERESARRVLRDAVAPGDAWFVTGDVLRIDGEGDYWFVDRAADMIRTPKGPVASVAVEDALYELDEVQHAVAYGVRLEGLDYDVPVATVVLREGRPLDGAALGRQLATRLDVNARPRFVRLAPEVQMSVGYRPLKNRLRASPPDRADEPALYCYDHELDAYEPADEVHYARAIAQLKALEQPAPTLRTLDSYPGDLGSRPDT